MPTIAGQPITRGSLREFEQGDWFADLATNSDALIPNGTRVEVVIENKTWSGAVVRGGITDAVGRYQVAGRPEWGAPLPAKASAAYRSAANVLRSKVLSDIAREVLGADWASLVVMPPPANLGQHYERPGTRGDVVVLGRDALELLGVPWYVRTDGLTVFDVRPSGNVTTSARVLVEHRNDAIGYRVVNCEDVAAFAPGLTFEGEVIGEVTYALSADDVKLHLWTRAAATSLGEAIRTWVRRLFPRIELQGVYTYVVAGPSQNGQHDLRSNRSRHLPDVRMADMWTIAGHLADLEIGTHVLVVFADADPSSPVLVGVDPAAAPLNASFFAGLSIAIDAAAVNLGGALAPVVRYGETVSIAGPGPASGVITFTTGLPPNPAFPSRVKA